MDFVQIKERPQKNGVLEIYPDFKICRSKDLMVRGKSFYAIWDDEAGLWSTDEYDVQRLVDKELSEYKARVAAKTDAHIRVRYMSDFSSNSWVQFRNYVSHISDNSHQLDESLTFINTEVTKKDYVSKRLNYPLERGDCPAFDEIIGTLYEPEERAKLEWAIGSVVAGDSRTIQKFVVLYGQFGAGKSTILNIIRKLFDGYCTSFDAKALTSNSNQFSTEVFKTNPLVAIQHDGDLSRIEDNTKINSIVSHEEMTMNEKYKPSYTARANCFLFVGTNKPVKITDGKSGVIRRLIDVTPSGRLIPPKRYDALMTQIDFELGAIAYHCLDVYRSMGKNYYKTYKPISMMMKTDVFFNFVEANYYIFKEQNGCTLTQAYDIYKQYCDEALVEFKLPRHKFREELKNYFEHFYDICRIEGKQIRSYYEGFLDDKFNIATEVLKEPEEHSDTLVLDCTESIFDNVCAKCPAQYAGRTEIPSQKWEEVTTVLEDLNTKRIHYVRVPNNHIVIDFDLKDEDGNKSAELNISAASKWPPTYAEFSKGGAGIHLHYIYDGDVSKLSSVYEPGIEIKVFNGNSSLRRRLSKCNNIPIATINSGLPLKGEKKMVNFDAVKSENSLRELIKRNLRKEIHGFTKPSIDFICKILDDAYNSGLKYDVSDMEQKIILFAMRSTNHAEYCLKKIDEMKFKSDEPSDAVEDYEDQSIVFFDCEVFPNLFLVNWKVQGKDKNVVRMINPTPAEIEELMKMKLVGFNCRRYDNHILYARYLGYTNEQLFKLSQKIIVDRAPNVMFSEAYNLSYTDIYDFCAKKQGLKKWEIELGIHHHELGLPWDEPVPEDRWEEVAEYCDDDVLATEATFEANQADFMARQILANWSGLGMNATTNQHTAKIIFGDEKNPQREFIYTDLSEMFPGYKFDHGKSSYRGEDPGEGGYVYAEPGCCGNVRLYDITSMHPTSIERLNLFGDRFTGNFSLLKQTRVWVKHNDIDEIHRVYGDTFDEYMKDKESRDALSYALKIAINSVYGMTSAKFDNKFKDPRNVDNIVAKRGALFMIDLKHAVQEKGYKVVHIKTDSIKIADADDDIGQFVMDFAQKYGYTFEHEATYDKMCLVNDAVYIAKYKLKDGHECDDWVAVGAQFQHPYVFKTCFTRDPIEFKDMCETKTVSSGSLYLDMNEGLPDVSSLESERKKLVTRLKDIDCGRAKVPANMTIPEMQKRIEELDRDIPSGHNYTFVGRAGQFCPILPGNNAGVLYREKDGVYYAAAGTKNYRWLESEVVESRCKEDCIDISYFNSLVDAAKDQIESYVDYEWFRSDAPYTGTSDDPIIPF